MFVLTCLILNSCLKKKKFTLTRKWEGLLVFGVNSHVGYGTGVTEEAERSDHTWMSAGQNGHVTACHVYWSPGWWPCNHDHMPWHITSHVSLSLSTWCRHPVPYGVWPTVWKEASGLEENMMGYDDNDIHIHHPFIHHPPSISITIIIVNVDNKPITHKHFR